MEGDVYGSDISFFYQENKLNTPMLENNQLTLPLVPPRVSLERDGVWSRKNVVHPKALGGKATRVVA